MPICVFSSFMMFPLEIINGDLSVENEEIFHTYRQSNLVTLSDLSIISESEDKEENIYIEETDIYEEVVEEMIQELELVSLGIFKIYHYCSCTKCTGNGKGITKSGTIATAGRTVAVDPKVIPLGSTIVIEGKEYIAEDTGGAIKQNKIDVFVNSHQEALNLGVKNVEVFIKQ